MNEIKLIKILIMYSPAIIFFEYSLTRRDGDKEQEESRHRHPGSDDNKKSPTLACIETGSVRTKKIRVNVKHLLNKPNNIELLASQLQEKFFKFFYNGQDEDSTVHFVDELKELLRKNWCDHTINRKGQHMKYAKNEENMDLNKISEEENLIQIKKTMELTYNSHRIKPSSKGYQYDVRADFDMISLANSWDEEECHEA